MRQRTRATRSNNSRPWSQSSSAPALPPPLAALPTTSTRSSSTCAIRRGTASAGARPTCSSERSAGEAKDEGDRKVPRRGELPIACLGGARPADQQRLQRGHALGDRPPAPLAAPLRAGRIRGRTEGGGRRLDRRQGNRSPGEVTAALGRHPPNARRLPLVPSRRLGGPSRDARSSRKASALAQPWAASDACRLRVDPTAARRED